MNQKRIEEQVKGFAPPGDFKSTLTLGRLTRSAINKLSKAIVAFGEALADIKLYPNQRDFAVRVVSSALLSDGEEITGLFSRQSGKSTTLAVVVNGMMVMLPVLAKYISDKRIQKFSKGCWIGIFAPAKDQADIIHGKAYSFLHSDCAKEILADDEIGISFDDKRQSKTLSLPNGSRCDANSAAKQAKIEGKTYHILICEESQDINIHVYKKSISPMGAATNASQVKIGTCNAVLSDFYEACQRNVRRDSRAGKNDLRNHFQYDYETAAKYNPWYRAYVKKEIERLGYDSDEFRMSYRLHWLLERGMFIDATLFDMLGKDYSPITFDNKNEVVVGIDVGKADASSVVTVIEPDYSKGGWQGEGDWRCKKRVLNWLELKGDDYVQQKRQIVDFLENFRRKVRIMIDATGVGQAMYDMLCHHYAAEIEAGKLEIVEFIATQQSNHDGYHRMLLDLQNERVEYPNSERAKKLAKQRSFVIQMTNLQKLYTGALLGAEAGEITPYKDYCSSLMLALLCADSREAMPEVQEDDNVIVASGVPHGHDNRRGLAGDRSRPWWRQPASRHARN